MATIITVHMPRNETAADSHVWPGIRIHVIDIVQPPGIGIPPIADMEVPQTIVTTALAAKSSAEAPKKAYWELRSTSVILVVMAPPDARFVAASRCAVEPLVHAPEAVQSAGIGGIGVI